MNKGDKVIVEATIDALCTGYKASGDRVRLIIGGQKVWMPLSEVRTNELDQQGKND